MRILMFDNEFPPLGGGTGVINYHFLTELATHSDVWVDLVTSSRSSGSYETERFAEGITIYKVPVDNRNIHHSTNHELLRYSWRGLLKSRELLKQHPYDLSFAFAGVPAGAISYALKQMTGLPYLVSLQGPDVPGFETRYNYLYPILKPILRQIWHHAAVVTASSREHQRLAYQTMPELDITVVYNGIDSHIFHRADKTPQNLPLNIVCVGRLIERKGQHYLLRAFAQLRNIYPQPLHLTLVGTGDAEDSLRCLADNLGINDAVTFAGFVSREEMPTIYQQADIFVLPSQNEGMSIALLEAMASGLPVVVTKAGGTEELVCEGENGYIVPWADVSALTEALTKLVQEQAVRQRMGQASQNIAGRFSWAEMTRQFLDLSVKVAIRSHPIPVWTKQLSLSRLISLDK